MTRTPRQTEGPFYPVDLPIDTDNDLLVVNDSLTPAVRALTQLGGRILNPCGEPVRNAVVDIHFAVKTKARDKFTTQCYVRGEPGNERDPVPSLIRDPRARESVVIDFAPMKGSKVGELAARFDIMLGFTPEG